MQLHITITTETLKDFDDVDYDVKYAVVTLDGAVVTLDGTFETIVSDTDIKIAMRSKLIDRGYSWDSEI